MAKNILIVDDEENLLLCMKSIIQNLEGEFNVLTAKDGVNALEELKFTPIDLLITDINMPDMDGLELIRKVQKKHCTMKIIAMSGAGSIYLRAANAFGASSILQKPFGKDELESAIHLACQ